MGVARWLYRKRLSLFSLSLHATTSRGAIPIPFDAGSIQATLELNRNPFTAGLQAAKAQAAEFKKRNKIELPIEVKLDRSSLAKLKKEISDLTGKANIKLGIDRSSLAAVKTKLKAETFSIKAKIDVDKSALSQVNQLRQASQGLSKEFDSNSSHFSKMASLIIGLLPVMASAFTATVGVVGSLAGAFLVAGAGAGALALVVIPAFKQIKTAVAGGQAEINKLPPGLREAGNAMKEMNGELEKLKKQNQQIVGIMLAAWFRAGAAALKSLNPLIDASAKAFTNVAERARIFFEGAWWQKFVGWLSTNMMPIVSRLGSILFSLIEIVGNLTRAFMDLGGSQILDMITTSLGEFSLWTDKIGQNKTFQAFMDAAVRSLPVVGGFLREVLEFVIKLAVALEPFGTLILTILTNILDKFNNAPVPVIQALALAIGGVWAAMALGAGGPVAIAIGVLAALGVIFSDLYTKNEGFRTSINNLIDDLKAKWQPIWDTIVKNFNEKIQPAWDKLWDTTENKLIPTLRKFGDVIEKEVWPKIQPLVDEITGTLIPSLLNFMGALERIIAFLTDVFGPTVADEMGSAITVFQGGFDIIAGLLDVFTGVFTGDWTTFTQGITEITRGFWTIVAGMFGMNLDQLRTQVQQWDRDIKDEWNSFWNGIVGFFQGFWQTIEDMWHGALDILRGDTETGATLIGRAWSRVANFFRDPINWVINTVINDGLIGAWNTVMGWIGVGGIGGRVPSIPAFGDAFAAGGPVQGGIRGKDSVPILAQQGEYVLSVPAVQNMGGLGAVDAMHSAARGGDVGRARGGPIQGYAVGGPVGMTTTLVSMWSLFGSQVESLFRGLSFGSSGRGGMIGDAISRIPGALVNKFIEAAQQKLSSIFQTIVTAIFGGGGGAVGGGDARAWIIAHESGGNPRAQNPTSSASGLYQFIDGTWRALGGSTAHAKDASVAEQNAIADRYVASRYGSWEGAKAFWQAHGWYDNGGWLPTGTTLTTNNTGQPEAVLTQRQLEALTSSSQRGPSLGDVAALIAATLGGGSGGGDVYNVMLPERASVRELADQLDFKRRVVSKGKYLR